MKKLGAILTSGIFLIFSALYFILDLSAYFPFQKLGALFAILLILIISALLALFLTWLLNRLTNL